MARCLHSQAAHPPRPPGICTVAATQKAPLLPPGNERGIALCECYRARIASMASSYAWVKGAASSAFTFSMICSGRLAPISAEVTTGSRSTQASAIWDSA